MHATLVIGTQEGNIGFAAAHEVVRSGAEVVVADYARITNDLRERIGAGSRTRVPALHVDVREPESIEAMLDAAFTEEPDLVNLIVATGVADPVAPLDISRQAYDRVMDVNLRGTFFAVQGFARRLIERGRSGAIATLASVAGRTGGKNNGLHYAASKAGVISITRGFARALGDQGIRVNAVAPGIIDTAMSRGVPGSDQQARETPLGRWGTIWEVADCLLYLISERSSYMTGAVLDLNGGQYSG